MIAAIYARKSTLQEHADPEAKSVSRQIESARAFATTKGWRVIEDVVFSDDAISGAEVKRLVNRQRLIDLILSGRAPFQVLVMRDDSRFSRQDGEHAFGELKRLAQTGLEIWFYQDGKRFTFGTFGDNVVGFVRAEMNAEYRRQIAKWTHEAMIRKAKSGYVCGGACFGYDNVRVDGHVERVINAAEAAIIRRIFTMSAAGAGYARIAKALNAEGVAAPNPRRGRPRGWGTSTVYEILHRPRYKGEVIYNKTRRRAADGTTTFATRPESDWIRVERPELQIIAPALWADAHARLTRFRTHLEEASKGRYGRRRRDVDSPYLLSGFMRCAVCGGTVCPVNPRRYGCHVHHKRGTTVCANTVTLPVPRLEHAVLARLRDLLQPTSILAAVDRLVARYAPATRARDHARQQRERARLDREIANLTNAIAQGGDFPSILAALKAAHARRDALTATIAARETVDVRQLDRPRIEAAVRDVLATWQTALAADVPRVRQTLRAILAGPLTLTPEGRTYRFEGVLLLGGVLAGSAGHASSPLLARPAGFEPATPGLEGRGHEAIGGSGKPLLPVFLGFSHTRGNPDPPPAATDCPWIVRDHDRDDNWSQPETRTRDRDDDARSLGRGPGNNRQESDQDARNCDGDPRWADRDRDDRERDREVPDAFNRHVHLPRGPERELVHDRDREYTLRGSESGRSRPLVHSEWSPVVISATTMGARLIPGPATCGTCANKGWSRPHARPDTATMR